MMETLACAIERRRKGSLMFAQLIGREGGLERPVEASA
jgi:hypothetical protein